MLKTINQIKQNLSNIFAVPKERVAFMLCDNTSSVVIPAEDFYAQYNPDELIKGHCSILGTIQIEGSDSVASFMLKDMVGCAGILVFHDLYVMSNYRNTGVAKQIFTFVQAFASHYGYQIIQSTDLDNNKASNALFKRFDWTKINTFTNPKTGNKVNVWTFAFSEKKSLQTIKQAEDVHQ